MDFHAVLYPCIGAALLLIGGFAGAYFRTHGTSQGQQLAAIADAMTGSEPLTDRSGTVIREAQPGFIAVQQATLARLDKVEDAVVTLTQVLTAHRALETRVDVVEGRADGFDHAIAAILAGTYLAGSEAQLRAAAQARENVVDGDGK